MSNTKGWGTGELIPTDAGFSWRVRLGSAGRKTFKLRDGLSPAEAEDRQAVLAEMKSRLKRAKAPVDRVERFLEQAADADAVTLGMILQVVEKQCGGKLVERRDRDVPTVVGIVESLLAGDYSDTEAGSIGDWAGSCARPLMCDALRVRPRELTLADCDGFAASLAMSPRGVRKVMAILNRALDIAAEKGWVRANPIPRGRYCVSSVLGKPCARGEKCVYFIGAGGFVKIGVSDSPERRLSGISTGCPVPPEILATSRALRNRSARRAEKRMHSVFAGSRSNGEWFRETPALRCAIQHVARTGEIPAWVMKTSLIERELGE